MVPKPILIMKHHRYSFRVMLFRVVPKQEAKENMIAVCFRVMLFRMVPKHLYPITVAIPCFRVMLFGMVPKLIVDFLTGWISFRVMLFRMVPKQTFLIWLFLPCFIVMLFKNKLSPQAIRNFHHKIRIFIIKDELLQFSKTNQVISQNVDRLRLVLPFFRKGFFY
ncbi:Uncharacterised protein [Enterococcus faecalis]|nr:hypothetical protein WO7_01949 [Enterococcus faecalis EnGen0355]VFA73408.1 Uncharacterised protein [Enterococcus faecalis]